MHERELASTSSQDDERTMPTFIDWQLEAQVTNLQVVNMTTPANYFHVLRRQFTRPFRKPLIVMSPKSHLRHRLAVSDLEDFAPGSSFQPVLLSYGDEAPVEAHAMRKIIFCSGRVYFDVLAACQASKASDVALVRLEQISPFPYHAVQAHLERFPNAAIVWSQEEPMNAGAWTYVKPRLQLAATAAAPARQDLSLTYAGRKPSAATATGLSQLHKIELEELLAEALR